VDAFALAIQNKCRIEPDGVQGHRDMIILNAIYESARKQQVVSIGY
jgi:predicted dehydrogenase